jgi:hypothetical protein
MQVLLRHFAALNDEARGVFETSSRRVGRCGSGIILDEEGTTASAVSREPDLLRG